jgi:hypothetical protein
MSGCAPSETVQRPRGSGDKVGGKQLSAAKDAKDQACPRSTTLAQATNTSTATQQQGYFFFFRGVA